MKDNRKVHRYNGVAIAFHWAIAILILLNFPIAWIMSDAKTEKALSFALFQLHKSIGISVLLLSLGRVIWRIMNPPPALPADLTGWERRLSSVVHIAFYVLMIGVQLLGWMMVSASPTGIPTLLFGFLPWPHIAPLANMTKELKESLHGAFAESHEIAAFGILLLLVLHVGGALKHQFIDKANYLVRILPGLFGKSDGPSQKPRGAVFALGAVIVALGAGALVGASKPVTAKPAVTAAVVKAAPLTADSWVIQPSQSSIKFTAKHSDKAFTGMFETWSGEIRFNPNDLKTAAAKITIKTASAKTGDAYYDKTLPEEDWFNSAKLPDAIFKSTSFRSVGADRYEAVGELSLHGINKPVILPFDLKIVGDLATMNAKLKLSRLDFNIGKGSDSDAEWVSDRVDLDIKVVAKKPGA